MSCTVALKHTFVQTLKPLLIDDFSCTSHLSDPLGVNLQLLLELADGSVLLLQLLH